MLKEMLRTVIIFLSFCNAWQELRWLLAWTFLGLCSCSSRDFLVSKSQETQAAFRPRCLVRYALFFCRGTLQLNRINEYKWIAALVFAQRFSSGTKEPCTPKWQLTTQNSHSSSLQEIVAFFPLDLSKNPRRWVLAHFFPLTIHDNFLGAVPSLYVFVCSLLVVLITSGGWFSEALCLQFLAMFHCRWCLREYTQPFKTS